MRNETLFDKFLIYSFLNAQPSHVKTKHINFAQNLDLDLLLDRGLGHF